MLHSFSQEVIDDCGRDAVQLLRRMVDSQMLARTATAIEAEAKEILKTYDAAVAEAEAGR